MVQNLHRSEFCEGAWRAVNGNLKKQKGENGLKGKGWIAAAALALCLLAGGTRTKAAEVQTPQTEPVVQQETDAVENRQCIPKKRGNKLTGWYTCEGKKYFVDSDGVRASGRKKIGRHTYYFKKGGVMASAEWVKKRGDYYYFGKKGRMKKGWLILGKKKYYLDEKGARVTGAYFIGEKGYYFNKAGVYRPKVKVKPMIDPKKPMVALTFDDGPGPYTDRLLKCLKENNAKATFFLVGYSVERYKDTVKKAYDMGCEIGNHSWNHPQLTSLDPAALAAQISSTNRVIRSATGHDPTLLRPPYGSYNSTVAAAAGMPLILWEVDTLDWKTRNVQSTIQSVMSNVKDGTIILMHDIHQPTVQAAEQIIPELKKKGYQLVTVSELAKYKKKKLNNGSVYSAIR